MAPQPRKLLEQVSDLLRVKQYSYRTEQTYIQWIRRYILFHHKVRPKAMGSCLPDTSPEPPETTLRIYAI
jgi:Phage integrase, N-terminal SAM-like domain